MRRKSRFKTLSNSKQWASNDRQGGWWNPTPSPLAPFDCVPGDWGWVTLKPHSRMDCV